MNLVKNKYVSMEEIPFEMDSKKKKSDYRIAKIDQVNSYTYEHEAFLINWFIDEIGDGKSVSFSAIKEYSRKNSRLFNKKLGAFKKIIKAEAEGLNLTRHSTSSYKIALYFLIFTIITSLILTISNQMYAFLLSAIFNSLLLFLMSFLIKKSTPELALEREKWISYKKYLKHITTSPVTDEYTLSYWEEALLYTIVFGYYRRAIKQLKVHYPSEAYCNVELTYLHSGSQGLGGIDFFSNSVTSCISNFSSTTGFSSGGSSSGGAGGGGGGGGAF
jgi:uncharacterized membrane protein